MPAAAEGRPGSVFAVKGDSLGNGRRGMLIPGETDADLVLPVKGRYLL